MTERYVEVDDKAINAILGSLEKIPKEIDNAVRTVALNSLTPLIRNTPHDTGTTARGWLGPKKLSDGAYLVNNSILTTNKKYIIVRLLDEGTVKMPERPWLDDAQDKAAKELEDRLNIIFDRL